MKTENDMIIVANGKSYTPPELLIYWIQERYRILTKKQQGLPKPWSDDKVFQTTYFCNVRREDDRVTKWIREHYSRHQGDAFFEYNIILTRFLNWPDTLAAVGYQVCHNPDALLSHLNTLALTGKVWGNAYVITTHGIPMPKARYLTHNVLSDVYKALDGLRHACRVGAGQPTCLQASMALQQVEGIGSFLAGQVVADLKNTPGHPLSTAEDWRTFVEPGPGSIKGASWYFYGQPKGVSSIDFQYHFNLIREYVDENWPDDVPPIHNQDLQNCLCEFDKYCRVTTGVGRSKRGYNGY